MRQRTKVGEHIELHRDGERLYVPASWARKLPLDTQRAEVRQRKANVGGKLALVTRYRLAPLVELPAWEPAKGVEDEWQTGLSPVALDKSSEGVGAAYWEFKAGSCGSWVEVNGAEWRNEEHGSLDEARAACESRLRELGYKVARATKPAKAAA